MEFVGTRRLVERVEDPAAVDVDEVDGAVAEGGVRHRPSMQPNGLAGTAGRIWRPGGVGLDGGAAEQKSQPRKEREDACDDGSPGGNSAKTAAAAKVTIMP